jgi:hypothetical protein
MARQRMFPTDRALLKALVEKYPPATILGEVNRMITAAPKKKIGKPKDPPRATFSNSLSMLLRVETKRREKLGGGKHSMRHAAKLVADEDRDGRHYTASYIEKECRAAMRDLRALNPTADHDKLFDEMVGRGATIALNKSGIHHFGK